MEVREKEVREYKGIMINARGGLYTEFEFVKTSCFLEVRFKRYRLDGSYNATYVAIYKDCEQFGVIQAYRHDHRYPDRIKNLKTVSAKVKEFVESHLW